MSMTGHDRAMVQIWGSVQTVISIIVQSKEPPDASQSLEKGTWHLKPTVKHGVTAQCCLFCAAGTEKITKS